MENHFIVVLHGVGGSFPIHLWYHILTQDEIILNFLRPASSNLKLSAKMILEGGFDFNKTPLRPPGTKVVIHENPVQQIIGPTWGREMVFGTSYRTLQISYSLRE